MPHQLLRNKSRQIKVGGVPIGGNAPVSIQSMTNTVTSDVTATLAQIRELHEAGCEIVRSTVLAQSPLPLIADIHFDYRLALGAIKAGVHAVRINPGNIGGRERVQKVAEAAGNAHIPIRVGANSGSLPKGLLESKISSGIIKFRRNPHFLERTLRQPMRKQGYGIFHKKAINITRFTLPFLQKNIFK